ncbi:MAG: DNA-directed RNA polymerase subunit A' [DPANN group archaeon]|nr:DNA-directed RNA polymerase subunit A' [DPANN group archaeon]
MITKKIDSVNFRFTSPEVIRSFSTIKVVTPDTYSEDGFPLEGGLMDLRLGVIDPGLHCKTCGARMTVCPGHFGHIELIRPVIHIGYVKHILILLKATCKECGKILLTPEEIEEYKQLLLKEETTEAAEEMTLQNIKEKSKKVTKCPHCKAKQDDIKLDKPTNFWANESQRLLPSQIRERLERIPDDEVRLLGINPEAARPEWTILTALPVPPVTTRPSLTLETGERSEDDLTHKLVDIIRINQRLSDNISAGAPQLIIEDLWDLLQYHVTTYFYNEQSGIPPARHRTGRALKTLFQRLQGKEGRFRHNLSGKRVNFSARTVISPDPELSAGEVGVPQEIAEILTVPEHVTEHNIKDLKKLIKNTQYPTVNYIIRPDMRKKKITELNRDEVIEELTTGYVVERQLIDGDVVVFNRQPSLHKHSMMTHLVKVLPGKTFRINDAAATPYNADYDGDEMNMHVPQSEEAKTEAKELMSVKKQILSVRHNQPLVVGQHDHVSGAYLLTKEGQEFTKEQTARLLSSIGIKSALGKPKYTGKEIFSMIIPNNMNLEYFSKKLAAGLSPEEAKKQKHDSYIVIRNGKIISGAMDSNSVAGSLLKAVYKQNGPEQAMLYIDRATKLTLESIMITGLTSSLEFYKIPEKTQKEINKVVKDAEKQVDELIKTYTAGKLERSPGKTEKETLEDTIMSVLNEAWKDSERRLEEVLPEDNHALIMARCGSRGNLTNVNQMASVIGQQAVRGKRLLRGYKSKSLPHFKENDISAISRGFIESNFVKGMAPLEYYFASMGGRDALMDKGIQTGVSGYLQRRLINALLDIVVTSDGSVRDSAGNVIQFAYGEDGTSPEKGEGDNAIDLSNYVRGTTVFEREEYREDRDLAVDIEIETEGFEE